MSISSERLEELNNFCNKYNLFFEDKQLLNQAFVHTSYIRENNLDVSMSYEKLEFYGDAVLKLVISNILYEKFSQFSEGELTKTRALLVSDKNIFEYAKRIGFCDLIVLGKNEKKQGGAKKESIIACAFEAFLGALFIEYKQDGYKKAKDFFEENFLDDILSVKDKIEFSNPKASLQEYTQAINHKLPIYTVVKEEGRAHNKTFFVEVSFDDKVIGKGNAQTIKQAEQNSACDALKNLGVIK
jgi:ribonuclease-3